MTAADAATTKTPGDPYLPLRAQTNQPTNQPTNQQYNVEIHSKITMKMCIRVPNRYRSFELRFSACRLLVLNVSFFLSKPRFLNGSGLLFDRISLPPPTQMDRTVCACVLCRGEIFLGVLCRGEIVFSGCCCCCSCCSCCCSFCCFCCCYCCRGCFAASRYLSSGRVFRFVGRTFFFLPHARSSLPLSLSLSSSSFSAAGRSGGRRSAAPFVPPTPPLLLSSSSVVPSTPPRGPRQEYRHRTT